MPPVVIAIIAIAAIVSAVFGVVSAFKSPSTSKISFGFTGGTQGSPRYGTFGPLDNTISNELAIPVLYGRIKIAGNVVWQSEGDTQVSRIVALCRGEVEDIKNVKANDISVEEDPSTGITPATGCTVSKYYGTTTQTVDSRVPTNTNAGIPLKRYMDLKNLAYVAVTLVASDVLKGGNPAITSVVCGLKVSVWNGSAWTSEKEFSRNPAAIIRDFLINTSYGLGIPAENLDEDSFVEVYNYCEEIIAS